VVINCYANKLVKSLTSKGPTTYSAKLLSLHKQGGPTELPIDFELGDKSEQEL
jgi:hypothetical protein